MSSTGIHCQKKEHVAIINIDINVKDMQEMAYICNALTCICDDLVQDSDIRAIVLTSSKTSAFFVGEDIISSVMTAQKKFKKKIFYIAEFIADLDLPVIAGIRGNAVSEGLELALACDLRICSETAHFSMDHLSHGGIPWDGGTQRLSRVVGRAKAMEMILTGETINAQEAHRIGLVHRVVPGGELLTVVMDMAREISTKSTIAVRYAKEAISKGMDLTLEQGLRLEADLYFLLHTTKDRTEGIKAFREKRPPRFKER